MRYLLYLQSMLGMLLCLNCGIARAVEAGAPLSSSALTIETLPPQFPAPPAAEHPVLVPQTGHSAGINSVVFSPDGRTLATGSFDRTVILWEVSIGKQVRTLSGHTLGVNSVTYSPDGRNLAWGTLDDTVVLLDVASGKQIRTLAGHTFHVTSVAFSSDGRILASGSMDKTVILWDATSGERVRTLIGHNDWVTSVAFSPDKRFLATGSLDHTVILWDVASGEKVRTLAGHTSSITSVAFSNDSRILASSSNDKTVILWDADEGKRLQTLAGHTEAVNSVKFNPDGRTLASGSSDNTVILWDVASGKQLRTLAGHAASVNSVAFSPDGRTLASGSGDQTAILWDVATKSPLKTLTGHTKFLYSIAFSPNGRTLASGSSDETVILWDAASGERMQRLAGHHSIVTSVIFSPNGQIIASGSMDNTVILWNAASGEKMRTLTGHAAPVNCLAFSPDSRFLASGSGDKTIILWDAASGAKVRTLAGHTDSVECLAFSPDGRALVSGSTNGLILWDAASGEKTWTLTGAQAFVNSVAFSPDGRTVASAIIGAIIFWDAASAKRLQTLTGHNDIVGSIAFSSDGRTLGSGSWDNTIILWDVASGKQLRTLAGHTNWIISVAIAPNMRMLASASWDGSIRCWDPATGKELAVFFSIDNGKDYLVTTPEGYYTSSLEATGNVAWRFGSTIFPFDSFSDNFNRPDLVKKALAGEDISNAPPLDATQVPPKVTFLSPKYGAEVTGSSIEVELEANGHFPIQRVELTVNGQSLPAAAAEGLRVAAPNEKTRGFKITVPLPPNEPRVRLRAVAYDTELLKSYPEEVTVFRPGVKAGVGTLHVLAVGINRYADPTIPALRYAVPDAEAIAGVFKAQGGGRPYTGVNMKLLTDNEATVSNLKFAVRELKDTATENDVAVIFLSGHGLRDKGGNFYFAAHDVDRRNLPMTALDWRDFTAALREVRAKRVLVLADTCHAGGIVGDEAAGTEALAAKINKEAHRLVFVSCGGREAAIGREEWGHGAFTKALLEALSGQADTDKNGSITFRELRDYVPDRVTALTEGRQHPLLPFLDQFEPEAVLAIVPKPAIGKTTP